jgi:hypothetical protein
MRRTFLIVLVFVVAAALAWEFIPLQVKISDGGFYLTVNVSSSAGPLHSVSCQAFAQREETKHDLDYLCPPGTPLWSAVADPFVGEPLKVLVPVSGRESPCGRELRRFQFRYLVVIGKFQDGQRAGKLVEVPDGRVSREVSVVLP